MRIAALAVLMMLGGPAWGQAVLDRGALPYPGAALRAAYDRFLLFNLPRVFVVSADGRGFIWGNGGTLENAREKALAACKDKGGRDCAIYAENLAVVWPGRAAEALPVPPGAPLLAGKGWAFVADARYFWWGPERAKGVYVYSHGKAANYGEERGRQAHPFVRAFNNAGFDVVKFERDPYFDDKDTAAQWLRDGLREMRQRGWRMVIAGGQSRGAWNSLQTLDTPGLAEAVIAISAATNGENPGRQATLGRAELYAMFSAAQAKGTRVAIVQFKDDTFEQDPERRFGLVDEVLRPRVGPLLTIDQPEGITGHGGGNGTPFAERYAGCLYRFATAAAPAEKC